MALADPIFTLVVGFQLVWAAFDLFVDSGTIKSGFRMGKYDFWAFQKIVMDIHLTTTCMIISIFTLDGGFQLFWAAFDLPMTVVPLIVALGLKKKMIFGHSKKNNKKNSLDRHLCDYFYEMPKNNFFFNPKATCNGTTLMGRSKAAQNN